MSGSLPDRPTWRVTSLWSLEEFGRDGSRKQAAIYLDETASEMQTTVVRRLEGQVSTEAFLKAFLRSDF